MQFTELLKELGISFQEGGTHRHVREGWVGLDCPFCGSKEFHLGYNLAVGSLSCWKCGRHNLRETLVALAGKQAFPLVVQFEQNRPFRSASVDEPRQRPHGTFKPPLEIAFGNGMSKTHRKYLKARGLDPDEMMKLWDISGLGPDAGYLAWRIYLPIHYRGRPVSWTTRAIGKDDKRRYISAPPECESLRRDDILYGLDYVRHAAIVTEGPFDCMAIGPGAVCTLGAAYSYRQMIQLSKFPVRVICYDADAQIAANKLADDLSPHPGETFVVKLETGEDPGSADKSEIREIRKRFLED